MAALLKAAADVLVESGAQRFTTDRVAEKAGISVGSLYQYFPNKAAILFRLQEEEWRATTNLIKETLCDPRKPPFKRIRSVVREIVRLERERASIRSGLHDAMLFFRDSSEIQDYRRSGAQVLHAFLREAFPEIAEHRIRLAGAMFAGTLDSVADAIIVRSSSSREADIYADALADMYCGYLRQLALPPGPES